MECDGRRFLRPPYFVTPRAYFENLGNKFADEEEFVEWFSGSVEKAVAYAAAAAESAAEAETERVTTEERAQDAEAWANGTRGGETVPEDDPAYGSNARHCAEQAEAAAGRAEQIAADHYESVDARLDGQDVEIATIRQQVSNPFIIAPTGADMLDTSKAYVYTGDGTGEDAGLERGAWYYYYNGAWVRGGVAVDDTLSLPHVPAEAESTGNAIRKLKSLVDNDVRRAYPVPFVPPNMATGEDNLIVLSQGSINSATGAGIVSSNGKKYRSQSGMSGEGGTMLQIGGMDLCLTLGLDWVDWCCWSYADMYFSAATHSNTEGFVSGNEPIFVPGASPDKRMCIAVQKKDGSVFSAAELASVKEALAFWRAVDTKMETAGVPPDAKAVSVELKKKSSAHPAASIAFFGDSITRGRIGGVTDLYQNSIPVAVGNQLGIKCTNFGVGSVGWCAGWSDANEYARHRTNAIGLLKRVGDPTYVDASGPYNDYKFLAGGNWEDYNVIVLAFGTNDISYPLGALEDIDDTISYSDVMTWKTSARDSTTGGNRTVVKAMYQAVRYIRESENNHAAGEPFVPGGKYKKIIISAPIIGSSGWDHVGSGGWTKREMCALYEAFCKKYACGFVQHFDAPINPFDATEYLPDGVHPNEDTYDALGIHFSGKLARLGG